MLFWIKILLWRCRIINPRFDIFIGEKNATISIFNRKYILVIDKEKTILSSNCIRSQKDVDSLEKFLKNDKKYLYLSYIDKTNKPFFKVTRILPKRNRYSFMLFEYPNFFQVNGKLVKWLSELFLSWKYLNKKDINQLYFKNLLDKHE